MDKIVKALVELEVIFTDSFISNNRRVEFFISTSRRVESCINEDKSNRCWEE